MFFLVIILSSIAFCPLVAAQEIGPATVIGEAVELEPENWHGAVIHLDWLTTDAILCGRQDGRIGCYDLGSGAWQWEQALGEEVRSWSVCAGHLHLLTDSQRFIRMRGADGQRLLELDHNELATTLALPHLAPVQICALDGDRIAISGFAKEYGPHGHIFSCAQRARVGGFQCDGFLRQLVSDPTGEHLLSVANTFRVRVWSLAEEAETMRIGDGHDVPVDAPFPSAVAFDGARHLVHAIDQSWGAGWVTVTDTVDQQELAQFSAHNGHVVMDVDFEAQRIALSGTSQALHVVDFQGKLLAVVPDAAAERVACVRFAPDGSKIAIGSWDHTIRVFQLLAQ